MDMIDRDEFQSIGQAGSDLVGDLAGVVQGQSTGMRSALVSLAMTQRRLAHQYRRWASEDEEAGRFDRCRKNRAESARLWEAAKFHLSQARDWRH